jgi:integral membrane protein
MENSFFSTTLGRFRLVALLEGVSYLVLLFIAMPMKYIWNFPLAVKYTGWAHGVLFVLYMLLLLLVWIELKWKFSKVLWAFVASLIPFGTFILDKQLQKNQ